MLTIQIDKQTLDHRRITDIICRIVRVRIGPSGPRDIYSRALLFVKYIKRYFDMLKARFPILKRIASNSLQTQVFIVIAVATLHNYVKQEARMD